MTCTHEHRIKVKFPDTGWMELCPDCQKAESIRSVARRRSGGEAPSGNAGSGPGERLSLLATEDVRTAIPWAYSPGTTPFRELSTQVPQETTPEVSSPAAGRAMEPEKRASSPRGKGSRKKRRISS